MKSTFLHANLNVFDLQKSLAFYDKALGLKEHRRKEAPSEIRSTSGATITTNSRFRRHPNRISS